MQNACSDGRPTDTCDLPRYQILVAAAQMPASCWGRYCRVAVVEVDPATLAREGLRRPRMISSRARGVVRVVRVWEKLYRGYTERCAAGRAIADAKKLVDTLDNSVRS